MAEQSFNHLHLASDDPHLTSNRPFIHGNTYLMDGEIREWNGAFTPVKSPIYDQSKPNEPIIIGDYPAMDEATAVEAVNCAHRAFNHGRGVWPTLHVSERIKAVEKFTAALKSVRNEIVVCFLFF